MSISVKGASQQPAQGQPMRRIWKTPTSGARWLWLGFSLLLYVIIFALYIVAIKTQAFPGPFNEPLLGFGVVAFLLVLATASYSLRRRFARGLPGKAQAWLWMHTWVGITAFLIALLHENFTHILNNYCQNLSCFTNSYWGFTALLALGVLVLSGVIGRLMDTWQAHTIARDASANGTGITRALEERILGLEYEIERLSAGKSEPF
jgi:membrane protease YdiL (CAAX protease family)